jgi:putative phosphoribosyl transferase
MIFKDRRDAGRQLADKLKHELKDIHSKDIIVVSLLRGGILVGYEIAKTLHTSHLPLVVSKISAPDNEELAIGAVCFDVTYLDREIISYLGGLPRTVLRAMIEDAQYKFNDYMERFMLRKLDYSTLKGKTIILVDDGIATGASVKAACLYISTLGPKKILAASPVVLGNFQIPGVPIISNIHNGATGSISQYYESFHQLEDDEILKLLRFS